MNADPMATVANVDELVQPSKPEAGDVSGSHIQVASATSAVKVIEVLVQ
jgi:hypothetical protein